MFFVFTVLEKLGRFHFTVMQKLYRKLGHVLCHGLEKLGRFFFTVVEKLGHFQTERNLHG